jgi:hypothetical protein
MSSRAPAQVRPHESRGYDMKIKFGLFVALILVQPLVFLRF